MHYHLLAAVLVLAGTGAILNDLAFSPQDPSIWNELGIGLLVFGLVVANYQLSTRLAEHGKTGRSGTARRRTVQPHIPQPRR